MKTLKTITLILALCLAAKTDAQFLKKLVKRAGEVAEETIKRKSEEKSERTAADAFDSVFNSNRLSKKERRKLNRQQNGQQMDTLYPPYDNATYGTENTENPSFSANTAFDFESGTSEIFSDNFSRDALGDFPARWDTNGSGEIVEISGEKWLRLTNSSVFLPMTKKKPARKLYH